MMFDPSALKGEKAEKAQRNKAIKQLRDWSFSIIPAELHEGLDLDIREVVCGDPACAPVDTIFTLVWESGGKGIFAMQSTAKEVEQDDLIEQFPVIPIFLEIQIYRQADFHRLKLARIRKLWRNGKLESRRLGRPGQL